MAYHRHGCSYMIAALEVLSKRRCSLPTEIRQVRTQAWRKFERLRFDSYAVY